VSFVVELGVLSVAWRRDGRVSDVGLTIERSRFDCR